MGKEKTSISVFAGVETSRLKPTPVALHNYGGGQLPRQVQTILSLPGYRVEATKVQRDAPARLLVGTDLLDSCLHALVKIQGILIF